MVIPTSLTQNWVVLRLACIDLTLVNPWEWFEDQVHTEFVHFGYLHVNVDSLALQGLLS